MSRTAAPTYAAVGVALTVWAVVSRDAVPLGVLILVGLAPLVHLVGPGRMGKDGADQHLRQQARARYGVNAPDRPRF